MTKLDCRTAGPLAFALAFFAMATLALAMPIHHVHMLHAALPAPAYQRVEKQGEAHHAHHHAAHVEHDEHGPAGATDASTHSDHDKKRMPRCPVCSTVKAGGVPILVALQTIAPAPIGGAAPLALRDAAAPASFHFRPVQPRAPPERV